MHGPDIDAVGRELAAFARLGGVPVLWRCFTAGEPWRRLDQACVLHCNPCCMAVKSDPLRWGRCRVQESVDLAAESLRRRAPWRKRCHAGLIELVAPILAGDRLLGALIAGPWRDAQAACPYRDAAPTHRLLPVLDERRLDDLGCCMGPLAARIAAIGDPPQPRDARVERALAWIDRHFAGRLSVAAAARDAGVSASRLAHLVRRQTGRSLQAHLAERRVAEARRLLMATGLPLCDVAAAAGFSDQSHLGLVFRRLTGMTPRRFRLVGGA